MPSLQLNEDIVCVFEEIFISEVQGRCGHNITNITQAYWAYLSLKEQKRLRFWDKISDATGLSRERIYKFFRFTWSRKFY